MSSATRTYDIGTAAADPRYDLAGSSSDPTYDNTPGGHMLYDTAPPPGGSGGPNTQSQSDETEADFEGFYAEPEPSAAAVTPPLRAAGALVINPVYNPSKEAWAVGGSGPLSKGADAMRGSRDSLAAASRPLTIKRGGGSGPTRLWWALLLLVALVALAALALAARGSGGSGGSSDAAGPAAAGALRADVDALHAMLNSSAVGALRAQVANLTQRLETAEARADGLETRLYDAETTIAAQTGRLDALAAALTRAENDTAAAAAGAQQAQAAQVQATAAMATLAVRLAGLEASLFTEDVGGWLKVSPKSNALLEYCPLYPNTGAFDIGSGVQTLSVAFIGSFQQIVSSRLHLGLAVATSKDGSVFVAGYSSSRNGDAAVARLSPENGAEVWSRQFGSRKEFDTAERVAVDSDGGVYVAGYTQGNAFGFNAGDDDVFVAGLNSVDGTIVWGQQYGSIGVDVAHDVAVSEDGGVYVVGETHDVMFGSSAGLTDAFVIRLSSTNGSKVWGFQFGSSSLDIATCVAVSADGGVYVVGRTFGDLYSANAGEYDVFVTRLSSMDGMEVWGRQWGSDNTETAIDVAASPDGGLYLTGQTIGLMYGVSADRVSADGVIADDADVFVTRLSSQNGTEIWGRQFNSGTNDFSASVAVSKDGRGVFVAGWSQGAMYGKTDGGYDIFLTRLNSEDGVETWGRQFGSDHDDKSHGVAASEDGSVHLLLGSTYDGEQHPFLFTLSPNATFCAAPQQ